MTTEPEYRSKPPANDKDWQKIWKAVDQASKAFSVTEPIRAVLVNWKPWAFGTAIFLWVQKPEILAAIQVILGGGK